MVRAAFALPFFLSSLCLCASVVPAFLDFARSLLAYELRDGRLKLLDGHLRRDLDPDMEVDARALLLSIDPLAALALTQEQLRDCLLELTPVSNANRQTA